jgi:hypothetical protein
VQSFGLDFWKRAVFELDEAGHRSQAESRRDGKSDCMHACYGQRRRTDRTNESDKS